MQSHIQIKNGLDKDIANLEETFTKLKFSVEKYNNLQYDQFVRALEEINRGKYTNAESCLCVVLTAGKENLIKSADNRIIKLNRLFEAFHGNKSLESKPKFFFVVNFQSKDHVDFSSLSCDNVVYLATNMKDSYIFHYWAHGIRDESSETHFISILCKHLKMYGYLNSFQTNIDFIENELKKTSRSKENIQFKFEKTSIMKEFIFSKIRNVKTGIAFIFCFVDSPDEKIKNGLDKNMKNLDETFTKLKFSIEKYNNLYYDQFERILEKISQETYTNVDSCVCVVLSTGKKNLITSGDNKIIKLNSFYEAFNRNRSLENKPKLFFANAYRNKQYISEIEHVDFLRRSYDNEVNSVKDTFRIFCVAYEIEEESTEFSDSRLVSFLCKYFNMYGLSRSFLTNIDSIVNELKKIERLNTKNLFEIEQSCTIEDFVFSN